MLMPDRFPYPHLSEFDLCLPETFTLQQPSRKMSKLLSPLEALVHNKIAVSIFTNKMFKKGRKENCCCCSVWQRKTSGKDPDRSAGQRRGYAIFMTHQ